MSQIEQLPVPKRFTRRTFINGVRVALCASFLSAFRGVKLQTVDESASFETASAVDPYRFGAKFDGLTDDTQAWQAAIDHAAVTGRPVRPSRSGTSLIRCGPLPRGTYGNQTHVAVYQALDINFSNLTIDLAGATLKVIGRGTSSAVNYAFGTAKNIRPGALRNFRLRNGTIDFDPTRDPSINKRALYLIGVDGIDITDLLLTSSGHRAGATITLQNCRTVRVRNVRGINVTQGMNLSFVEDVVLDTLLFDNFREAIDCDRKVTRLIARNLTFRNGGPNNQCLDLNSVTDVLISGILASNVGNIALINYKVTTPPTYTAYVNNEAFETFSPSKNVTIEKVRADKICFPQSVTRPFILGNDQHRPEESAFHLENITLRDVVLTNCPSFIPIELVKNATLANFHFQGAVNPIVGMGCIDIRSDFPGTATSVSLRNVTIEMGVRASRGVRATGPASVRLSNVSVTGISKRNTIFFDFVSLEKNGAVVRLERVKARADAGSGGTAFRFGGTGYSYSVVWAGGNCVQGKFARQLALDGSAAKRINVSSLTAACGI